MERVVDHIIFNYVTRVFCVFFTCFYLLNVSCRAKDGKRKDYKKKHNKEISDKQESM
jgi:hypothetical protein